MMAEIFLEPTLWDVAVGGFAAKRVDQVRSDFIGPTLVNEGQELLNSAFAARETPYELHTGSVYSCSVTYRCFNEMEALAANTFFAAMRGWRHAAKVILPPAYDFSNAIPMTADDPPVPATVSIAASSSAIDADNTFDLPFKVVWSLPFPSVGEVRPRPGDFINVKGRLLQVNTNHGQADRRTNYVRFIQDTDTVELGASPASFVKPPPVWGYAGASVSVPAIEVGSPYLVARTESPGGYQVAQMGGTQWLPIIVGYVERLLA